MTTKDKLLHWAAQLDQVLRELETEAKLKEVPLGHGHEMMVIHTLIGADSRRLIKLASRF